MYADSVSWSTGTTTPANRTTPGGSFRRCARCAGCPSHERDDSIGGTEMTLDDFSGFSGRVLDHSWRFSGLETYLARDEFPTSVCTPSMAPMAGCPTTAGSCVCARLLNKRPSTTATIVVKSIFGMPETYETGPGAHL